jgi:Tfp pilus assembly protein PilE
MKGAPVRCRGFTSIELLLVLALGAVIVGGAVVSYGTLVRNQPRVASFVSAPLGNQRMNQFFGLNSSTQDTPMAPHYGSIAQAEELREQFYADVTSSTAVFCLPREGDNTWKPSRIPYDPLQHAELDTPQAFRSHLVTHVGVSPALYRDYRNPLDTAGTRPSANASIFILGYSREPDFLKVVAIYDIDVIRFTARNQPNGFHTSVKRYAGNPGDPIGNLVFAGGYQVFFPPSVPDAINARQWSRDGFTPLFVTFERSARLANLEIPITINRFKKAAEQPFYFIWWPDPAARHLGPVAGALPSSDPRRAYNHMAGRTSYMFTVPMFPAL